MVNKIIMITLAFFITKYTIDLINIITYIS